MELSFVISVMVVILILAATTGIVIWAIKASQREKARKAAEASQLGFQPVPNTELSKIKSRLADANPKFGKSGKELRNVFRKETPDGSLIVYDLWDTDGEGSAEMHHQAMLLVVPDLNLPKFVLLPKPVAFQNASASSVVGSLVNKLASFSSFHSFSSVDLSAEPELDRKFILAGEPADEVNRIFTSDLLWKLEHLADASLAGGKQSLLFTPQKQLSSSKDSSSELAARTSTAFSTFRILLDALR